MTKLTILKTKGTFLSMLIHLLSRQHKLTSLLFTLNRFLTTSLFMNSQRGDRNHSFTVFALNFQDVHDRLIGIGPLHDFKTSCFNSRVPSLHLKMQVSGFFSHQFSRQGLHIALSQLSHTQWGIVSTRRQTGQTTDCRVLTVCSFSTMMSS